MCVCVCPDALDRLYLAPLRQFGEIRGKINSAYHENSFLFLLLFFNALFIHFRDSQDLFGLIIKSHKTRYGSQGRDWWTTSKGIKRFHAYLNYNRIRDIQIYSIINNKKQTCCFERLTISTLFQDNFQKVFFFY